MEQHEMTLDWGREQVAKVEHELQKRLFGINKAIRQLLTGFFSSVKYSRGAKTELGRCHVLLMAAPGFGKTDMMQGIAHAIDAKYSFIAGHPEIKVSEIMGGDIYEPSSGTFFFAEGPIFTNIFLVDEINRIHPKPQALTLQGMEERTAFLNTINIQTKKIENRAVPLFPVANDPQKRFCFWMVASGNPFEQEGTYPLPEAQLDRFSISLNIDLPSEEDELRIRRDNVYSKTGGPEIQSVMNLPTALDIAEIVTKIKFESRLHLYKVRLLHNSRPKSERPRYARRSFLERVDTYVKNGLSPRADFHMEAIAQGVAFMNGNDFVSVDDVQEAARLVMPHRILLDHKARGKIKQHELVEEIIAETEVP